MLFTGQYKSLMSAGTVRLAMAPIRAVQFVHNRHELGTYKILGNWLLKQIPSRLRASNARAQESL